ncbi:PE-PGRS family protein [Streptomyces sp. NPDC049887]|uniref:DUF6907 domain-containing protein n=1 Tax=Streptomyces sp. NPDC049887 TaxID=3155654 RepID=UPI003423DFB3
MSFTVPSPDKGTATSIPASFRPSGAPLPGVPAQPQSAEEAAVRRSVGAQFPKVAAFLAEESAQPAGRTFTYPLLGGGTLTATCPKWCTADHTSDAERGIHPSDLCHEGDEIALEMTTEEGTTDRILAARIMQWPFASGDGSADPHMALMPEAGNGEALGYQTPAEVNATIRQVEAHLFALRQLSEQLAEARAVEHAAYVESLNRKAHLGPVHAWLSLHPDDVQTMPIAYLMKAFGAEVVEVEPGEVGIEGELSSTGPEDVVIVLPRILTQILRERAVRRLLLSHLLRYQPRKQSGE